MKKLICLLTLVILVSGCIIAHKEITPLTNKQMDEMEIFSYRIKQIESGMSPQDIKEVLGEPDFIDKETDINIKNQDVIWTFKHPIIDSARFIVIFRDNGVELSTIAVTDVNNISHYLTRDEF